MMMMVMMVMMQQALDKHSYCIRNSFASEGVSRSSSFSGRCDGQGDILWDMSPPSVVTEPTLCRWSGPPFLVLPRMLLPVLRDVQQGP